MYIIGSCSSTSCDGDRSDTCDNSLCAGCMDPGFVETGSTSDSTDCDGSVSGNSTTIDTGDDDDDIGDDDSDSDGTSTGPASSSGAWSIGEQCKTVFLIVASIVTLFGWTY